MHNVDAAAAIERLAELASGIRAFSLEAEARDLTARISEGRFYLACLGQFKRGKSTIIDALLGEAVLPVGVLPVTSVPTIVRHGAERAARVRLGGSDWRTISFDKVEDYVSEAENPGNAMSVAAIEVFFPSSLLASGLCLVDTPGIDSVFEANTQTTLEFVPRIDAALLVLGADPPISRNELDLIDEICGRVDSLLVVVNKADRVSPDELKAAKEFARRALSSRLKRPVEIYEVSARAELDSGEGLWEWPEFRAALDRLASVFGRGVTYQAQQRSAERLAQHLLRAVDERRDALATPLAESEKRLAILSAFMDSVERSALEMAELLSAEQGRSSRALAARRAAFLAEETPVVQALVRQRLAGSAEQGLAFRHLAVGAATETTRERLVPWLEREQRVAESEYRHTIGRFNSRVKDYLAGLAASGVPELSHIAESPIEGGKLTAPSGFHFHKLLHIAEPASPFRILGDALLGALRWRDPIRRDADEFVARLMETNASRVEADLNQRLALARKELEAAIGRRLAAVRKTAEESLRHTREVTGAGEESVRAELARLEGVRQEVMAIQDQRSIIMSAQP